jgi:hypothetical protein
MWCEAQITSLWFSFILMQCPKCDGAFSAFIWYSRSFVYPCRYKMQCKSILIHWWLQPGCLRNEISCCFLLSKSHLADWECHFPGNWHYVFGPIVHIPLFSWRYFLCHLIKAAEFINIEMCSKLLQPSLRKSPFWFSGSVWRTLIFGARIIHVYQALIYNR